MGATQANDVFYVATDGNDEWSGKVPEPNNRQTDGPFATLTRARDAIRQMRMDGGLRGPVDVVVRGGTHFMAEPLRLTAGDSGTADCPIRYLAAGGEEVALSGGRRIDGWERYQGEIWRATLPLVREGGWWFRQLFFNGRRCYRARWPNADPDDPLYGGWHFIEAVLPVGSENPTAFRFEDGEAPKRWSKPEQAEVFVIPGLCWISDIIPVRGVRPERREIALSRKVMPSENTLAAATALRKGNRFYVENVIEELDQPGEWCLDASTGTLYFWPPDGDIEAAEVTAPTTDRLIQLVGTPADPVHHIEISGFKLTQTLAGYPSNETYYKTPNAGQALYLEHATDCVIQGNHFDHVGGDAIRLQSTSARNRIIGNHIEGAGAYGVFVGHFQRGFSMHDTASGDIPSPPEWSEHPEHREPTVRAWPRAVENEIRENRIHHCGVFEKHGSGIAFFGVSSVDNVVAHNHIHDVPRFGIATLSGFGRVVIEHNHIHDVSLETADTGGICANRWYTFAGDEQLNRGNVVRFNLVRNVVGCGAYDKKMEPGAQLKASGKIWTPYYGWGIYFDNAPMNVHVYGNVTQGNTLGGLMISHFARDVLVENNVFADGAMFQFYMIARGEMGNIVVRKNVFSLPSQESSLFKIHSSGQFPIDAITEFDYNVYDCPSADHFKGDQLKADQLKIDGIAGVKTFADWTALGFDRHSIVADARFVDRSEKWRGLQADSPALPLGLDPVDLSRVGPPQ